jgi:ATP-dependent exoDNAse (exonuclease V) beta subunit
MTVTQALKKAQAKYYQQNKTKLNNKHAFRAAMKLYPFIENEDDYELWRVMRSHTKKLGTAVLDSDKDIDPERISLFINYYLHTIIPNDTNKID